MHDTLVFRLLEEHAMVRETAAATGSSSSTAIEERGALLRRQREFTTAAIRERRQYPPLTKAFCRLSSRYRLPKRCLLHNVAHSLGLAICMFALTGCLSRSLSSIQVLPAAGSSTMVAGQTVQFQAVATYTESGHATTTKNVTSQATWVSATPVVATINSAGLATGVSAGTSNITASLSGSFGTVVGTSNVAVTGAPPPRILTSLVVIPASQAVSAADETAQFIAIGTYSAAPLTQDLTDQVSWQSSDVKVATVDPSGLATGIGAGQTTITALATASDGSVISAIGSLTDSGATGPVNLPTLTIYEVGDGTGTVTGIPSTGPSAGVAVINCGVGFPATGCMASFSPGTVVTLIASPASGSLFDGWSANCTPDNAASCTVTMNNNDTVGVIFDLTNP